VFYSIWPMMTCRRNKTNAGSVRIFFAASNPFIFEVKVQLFKIVSSFIGTTNIKNNLTLLGFFPHPLHATPNQSSPQVRADSHLSAHHVTPVTDAGGSVQIRPAEGVESVLICVICGQKSGYAASVFWEIPAQ